MDAKQTRRMTKQRQVILEELRKLLSHPTVDDLHQIVRKRLPKISIATVYRNLEILCEEGLAQKMDTPGTQRRFDGNVGNHYHIRCCSCGRVDDVDLDPIPMIEEAIKDRCDYAVMSHRLEFIGICSRCAAAGRLDSDGWTTGKGKDNSIGVNRVACDPDRRYFGRSRS